MPGYVVENGPRRFEIWNGLALVVLDERRRGTSAFIDSEMYDAAAINRRMRDQLRAEVGENGNPVADAPGESGPVRASGPEWIRGWDS